MIVYNESSSDKIILQYDTDGDGYLNVEELRKLVERNPEQCRDLPREVTEYLHETHDENEDGMLDFEEFYKLTRKNHWIVRDWCVKYCEYIIPPRKHPKYIAPQPAIAAFDQVDQGEDFNSLNLYYY